jgi:hypothetical protein
LSAPSFAKPATWPSRRSTRDRDANTPASCDGGAAHLFGAALLLTGCTAPPATSGSCGLALTAGTSDNDAIRAVIEAEGRLVVTQAIDALMALWAEDAYVANAKNTPDDATDDQFWRGQDAIRHRYVRTVFPGAPARRRAARA